HSGTLAPQRSQATLALLSLALSQMINGWTTNKTNTAVTAPESAFVTTPPQSTEQRIRGCVGSYSNTEQISKPRAPEAGSAVLGGPVILRPLQHLLKHALDTPAWLTRLGRTQNGVIHAFRVPDSVPYRTGNLDKQVRLWSFGPLSRCFLL